MMGVFDLIGTTASGWLTDRYDPRKLLFVYYGLRGLSLIYLPYSDFAFYGLSLFAVFYGLDWIATVPPTLRLANEAFGDRAAPIVFGWIVAGHQMGAASAAFFGGALRSAQGTYLQAFFIAGAAALLASGLSLLIARPVPEERVGPANPGEADQAALRFLHLRLNGPENGTRNGPRLAKAGAGVRVQGPKTQGIRCSALLVLASRARPQKRQTGARDHGRSRTRPLLNARKLHDRQDEPLSPFA